MNTENVSEVLNSLWLEMLKGYPDGVSNTSTTKYNSIRELISRILAVPASEVYATGAKTRPSNLDTRFVQGNQAGRHTKIGVAFMQTESQDLESLNRLSDSAVVTSRKFVDGSDKTQYDAILVFVESEGGLLLKRVIQRDGEGYFEVLKRHFKDAELVTTGSSGSKLKVQSSGERELFTALIDCEDLIRSFVSDAHGAFLRIESRISLRFVSSLLSKRFLILTGLSGSGKTKLAQAFAHWVSPSEDFFKIIPVGADWTGNENILGYPDGLNEAAYVTKPALDLILHAGEHKESPHFLILDEMNLSHVERYFADILSMIESEAKIYLHGGGDRKAGETMIPEFIELPKNLFIIGTVNVDETTYMFSPKVLDRANVIEFRMDFDELSAFLSNPAKPDLSKLGGKGEGFGKGFVGSAASDVEVPAEVKEHFDSEMLRFFEALQAHGGEFGFRTAYEAARFIHFYKVLGDQAEGDGAWFDEAFDSVVFQKLLPKLHGSRAKLEPILRALWDLCVIPVNSRQTAPDFDKTSGGGGDVVGDEKKPGVGGSQRSVPSKDIPPGSPYPMSAEKIYRMWRLMMENGFASFAEA